MHPNDPIKYLKGLGKAKENKLLEAWTHVVKDLLDCPTPPEGFTARVWQALRSNAPEDVPSKYPIPSTTARYQTLTYHYVVKIIG